MKRVDSLERRPATASAGTNRASVSSLLMSSAHVRIFGALMLVAVLWLGVAWALVERA